MAIKCYSEGATGGEIMTEENIKKLQDLLRKKDKLEKFIEFREWGVVAMGQRSPIIINEKGFDVAPGAMIEDKEIVGRFIALAQTMLIEVKNEIAAL